MHTEEDSAGSIANFRNLDEYLHGRNNFITD